MQEFAQLMESVEGTVCVCGDGGGVGWGGALSELEGISPSGN